MGSVRLPQAQLSEIQQPKPRKDQTQAILDVLGNNPLAQGIQSVGTDITSALEKRAAVRQQVEQQARAFQQQKDLLDIQNQNALARELAKQQAENYSPEQLKAIESGQMQTLSTVYPKGVPQNALSLFSTIQNRKSLDADRDENRRIRDEQFGVVRDEKTKNRYRNYVLDMEQRDPVIKEMNKQRIGLDQVDGLIDTIKTGNTIAANALGAKVARAMGEVGVMTDTDVVRYVQSGKLTQGAADKLKKMATGTPTDTTLDEIKQIASVLKDNFSTKVQPRYDQYIDSYSSIEGDTPEGFSDKIKIRYGGKAKNESPSDRKARLLKELAGAR